MHEIEQANQPTYHEIMRSNQQHCLEEGNARYLEADTQTIHANAMQIFGAYLDPETPPVALFGSNKHEFTKDIPGVHRYEVVIPERVRPEERKAYRKGIVAINEWMTNLAARRYFVEKFTAVDPSDPKQLAKEIGAHFYGDMMDLASYGIIHLPVELAMEKISSVARAQGIDFRDAVFKAFFQHDPEQLNQLIASTRLSTRRRHSNQPEDITDLAILLGRQVPTIKGGIRVGVFAIPGVAQISPLWLKLAGFGIGTSFVEVHESMHGYSADENWVGVIPKRLIPPKQQAAG